MPILILLLLAGLFGLPQYFHRFRGITNRWLYITAAAQLLLLAAAALVAATGGWTSITWGAAASFSVIAASIGGGPVTMSILRLSERSVEADLRAAGNPQAEARHFTLPPNEETTGTRRTNSSGQVVLQGGAWIGLLERTAIASTLWSGWPEGLAIVLAVKGLGRYAELGKDGAAERFILGTFASVLWACACTGIAVLATR
ncbi:hypothetical protein ACTXI0_03795 [Arthrobacter rhombi]|uniref:hypothetical protein n=1 Tax=Arthrobacter rhombi TaxID=71253 RepID=UPI003FD49FF2